MVDITKLEPKEPRGLIVVITGHGKGKTTTAFGLAVRACGHDMRVCIIQFMKGDLYSGEWDGVKKMNCPIELHTTGKGFCGIQGNPYPFREHRQNAQDAIALAQEKIASGLFDLIILDEINNALHLRLVKDQYHECLIGNFPFASDSEATCMFKAKSRIVPGMP